MDAGLLGRGLVTTLLLLLQVCQVAGFVVDIDNSFVSNVVELPQLLAGRSLSGLIKV
jgi:NCAIR mutase (PurE)-related protein